MDHELNTIKVEVRSMTGYEIELDLNPFDGPSRLSVQGFGMSEPLEFDLRRQTVERIFAAATALRLPAAPQVAIVGCDGGTCKVTFIAGMHESSFEWWVEPPSGWEPLEQLAQQIITMAKRRVPPGTLQVIGF